MNYYNENDPGAAAWLRELIQAGLIPPGDVDDRSIKDVEGSDLEGYTQCHFFAGIGGWPRALELAGWPPTKPVWTGSCPCQPLSVAGLKKGAEDKRHLWPEFARLICECEPAIVFGEQVASKLGREWFSGVRLDLEEMGYAVGAADLCAASVGAPHIRQRLFWVADTNNERCDRERVLLRDRKEKNIQIARHSKISGMGNTVQSRRQAVSQEQTRIEPPNFWANSVYIACGDGKARRIGIRPSTMVDGVSGSMDRSGEACMETIKVLTQKEEGRAMLLRGYGNAIVPQVAAEFIRAFKEG